MLIFAIVVLAYVLGAIGYYAIASRRGIDHAWLAWVPVANGWLHGCIADQYQSVVHNRVRRKRTVLLILSIVSFVCAVIFTVLFVSLLRQMITIVNDNLEAWQQVYEGKQPTIEELFGSTPPQALLQSSMRLVIAFLVLALMGLSTVVMRYLAMYDLFRSCDPFNAVLYLLLSIFLGVGPFLVYACRERDLGMPEKETPTPVFVSYQPTAQEPQDTQ